jgi:hypothetical protein
MAVEIELRGMSLQELLHSVDNKVTLIMMALQHLITILIMFFSLQP